MIAQQNREVIAGVLNRLMPGLQFLSRAVIAIEKAVVAGDQVTIQVTPGAAVEKTFPEAILRTKGERTFREARLNGCRVVWESTTTSSER